MRVGKIVALVMSGLIYLAFVCRCYPDEFKTFLQRPPSGLELLFSVENVSSGKTDYYLARFQPNGVFARRGPSKQVVIEQTPYADRAVAVASSNGFWALERGILRVYDNPTGKEKQTDVLKVQPIVYEGKTALCLGISSIAPGSVSFNGDSFEAPGIDGVVHGELVYSAGGRVKSIKTYHPYLNDIHESSIVYRYRKNLGPTWLPSGWECKAGRPEHEKVLWRYELISIRTNSVASYNPSFSYKSALDYDVVGFIFYTNNTEVRVPYDRHHDNYVSFLKLQWSPKEISSLWRASFLAFSVVIAYFALITRAWIGER